MSDTDSFEGAANFEAIFAKSYERAARAARISNGFAVREDLNGPLTAHRRAALAQARSSAALRGLVELQHWLVDDEEPVREVAQAGMRQVMYQACAGDQSERAWRTVDSPMAIDRLVARVLTAADPDGPAPWWAHSSKQRRVRNWAIVSAFFFAAVAAVAAAMHRPLIMLPMLCLAASFDILDGAFARTVRMRSAELRWRSCIGSQAGDLLIIGGIAIAQAQLGNLELALPVIAAMMISLFGSFVRVSALQAGYRMWRSRAERYVRYGGMLGYGATAATHHGDVGALALAFLIGGFGFYETARVVGAVVSMPSLQGGGIVFVDQDHGVHAWALSDDGGQSDWYGDAGTATSRRESARAGVVARSALREL